MSDLLDDPSLEASLDDLKIIYRILEQRHREAPEELAGNVFFESMRALLQGQALAEGVDVEDTAQWDAWLLDVEEDDPESLPPGTLN